MVLTENFDGTLSARYVTLFLDVYEPAAAVSVMHESSHAANVHASKTEAGLECSSHGTLLVQAHCRDCLLERSPVIAPRIRETGAPDI